MAERRQPLPKSDPLAPYGVFSGQLVASGRRGRQRMSVTLARCAGNSLLGTLHRNAAPLLCEASLDATDDGRRLRLFASGLVRKRPVWFAGVLNETDGPWTGHFVVTDNRGAVTDEGTLRLPKVLYQDAGRAPKPGDPCGKLVYESPVQVNREKAPGGTQKVIRFKILRYELCVFVLILPPDGGDRVVDRIKLASTPGAGATIHRPDGTTVHVQGYSDPAQGRAVGKINGNECDFYGKFAVFVVDGCKSLKFVQFVKQTQTIGEKTDADGWKVDGGKSAGDPFPGTLPAGQGADDGAGSMTDWPGRFEPATIPLKFGTKVDLTQDLESYVCCDGKCIGYWKWRNHVSYTAKNGQATDLNVDRSPPTWERDPTTGANFNDVKCA